MTIADRRDSFCGKMSLCNNLRQYGIRFTLTKLHTVAPKSDEFQQDLVDFAGVCRVVRGLKGLRIGALGRAAGGLQHRALQRETARECRHQRRHARPLRTLRLGRSMADDDAAVQGKLAAIKAYVETANVPAEALMKMAKFGVAVDNWMAENQLDATAIQCWTAMEEFFGIVPCTVMSMMSNNLMPSACEVDVMGTVAMVALAMPAVCPAPSSTGTTTTATTRTRA